MPSIKVVLLACGSYNPPTNMHLRMFEIARDYLQHNGKYTVVGGLMSPVHDAYGKKDLVSATDRLQMLRLALDNSDWIKISDWECRQETWSRTRATIEHHQNLINAALTNGNMNDIDSDMLTWIPNNRENGCTGPVQVKLLCGADLLESFGTPGLWAAEDIHTIVGQHGLVVITREGSNPLKFIYESDVLNQCRDNIHIVTEWISNEVSSTKIRRALRRSESVKYLIPDTVIDYICKKGLYGAKELFKYTNYTDNKLIVLTPSPTDITMESPSPTDTHNCINICNNNLFMKSNFISPNHQHHKTVIITDVHTDSSGNKTQTFRHPGQAVKIYPDNTAGIKNKPKELEVGTNNKQNGGGVLKTSKSCVNIEKQRRKIEFRSNSEICDYENFCDENMIKFIFTKHGIQVISDIETVV